MRQCRACNGFKPDSDFRLRRDGRNGGRHYNCIECQKAYGRNHYTRDKAYYKAKRTRQRLRDQQLSRQENEVRLMQLLSSLAATKSQGS